ncbi:helix-turn-helix transcriptional regulator [Blastococcus capsensis]|uniref:helix-turn-helix transcriptional regulator n=1 Tax=Blastococcus capsensis TaxID=1564163 RepID=UPI0032B07CCF
MAVSWADVGDRVRQARLARGLTQGQLAEQVTLHRTAVARIEAGDRQFSALELFALADALRLPRALLASSPPVAVTSRRAVKVGAETPVAASSMVDAMIADGARFPFQAVGFTVWHARHFQDSTEPSNADPRGGRRSTVSGAGSVRDRRELARAWTPAGRRRSSTGRTGSPPRGC